MCTDQGRGNEAESFKKNMTETGLKLDKKRTEVREVV